MGPIVVGIDCMYSSVHWNVRLSVAMRPHIRRTLMSVGTVTLHGGWGWEEKAEGGPPKRQLC